MTESTRKALKEMAYLSPSAIIIVIYLNSPEENDHNYRNGSKICQKCFTTINKEDAVDSSYCRTCAAWRWHVSGLTKAGLILATIVIDFGLLIGSGSLAAAVIVADNLALGLLALPAIIGLFCYVIGGNKLTYVVLKSVVEYTRKNRIYNTSFNWEPARDALKGDGFMVGLALFVIITLIVLVVLTVAQFGNLEDDSYYAMAKLIMIAVVLILMIPLIGIAAKIVGNEKAAAECGYNSMRGILHIGGNHGGNAVHQDNDSAGNAAGDNSGGSDCSYSF